MGVHSREYKADGVEYVLIAHRRPGSRFGRWQVLATYANLDDARTAATDQMHPFISVPTGDWDVLTTAHGYLRITIHKVPRFPSQKPDQPAPPPAPGAGDEESRES